MEENCSAHASCCPNSPSKLLMMYRKYWLVRLMPPSPAGKSAVRRQHIRNTTSGPQDLRT